MVAATRSRVFQACDETSAHKTGAAPASIREFRDELGATEIACNLMINYSYRVKKRVSPSGSPEYCVQRKPGRRPGKQNLCLKRRRNTSLLKGDDVGIGTSRARAHNGELVSQTIQQGVEANENSIHSESQSTSPSSVQSTTPSSKVQILRRDFGASEVPKPSEKPSTNPSSGQSISPPLKLSKFGMYAGRVKANPLKYLASVLRSKLQPYFEACNLLEVATEIHDEAKNKHNTTLRRIYDVVNVLEAAGLLERSNGSTPRRLSRTRSKTKSASSTSNTGAGSPSTEGSTSAVEFEVELMESHDEQIKNYWRNRTTLTEKTNPLEMKNTRGSRIRWLGSETEREERCDRQTFGRLTEERIAFVQRISEKQLELEYLQEEVRLTTELIKQNQNRIYQSDCFESDTNRCTPPREDLSYSYLNFDDCSQTSAETECKPASVELQAVIDRGAAEHDSSMMCGSSWSSLSRDFDSGPSNLNIVTQEDLNFWYNQSTNEVEVNILEAAEQYQSNGLPLMNWRTAAKGLHTPFVILQTSNATNVDIELGGDLTSEVHIVLDNEYKLFDYRALLSIMFPTHDRDGGFPSVDGL